MDYFLHSARFRPRFGRVYLWAYAVCLTTWIPKGTGELNLNDSLGEWCSVQLSLGKQLWVPKVSRHTMVRTLVGQTISGARLSECTCGNHGSANDQPWISDRSAMKFSCMNRPMQTRKPNSRTVVDRKSSGDLVFAQRDCLNNAKPVKLVHTGQCGPESSG